MTNPSAQNKILKSKIPLGPVTQNIATLLLENRGKFASAEACAEKLDGQYHFWTWKTFVDDVFKFAAFLADKEIKQGDRVAFLTSNSYHRLVSELAVMAYGAVSVPIFAGYPKSLITALLQFTKAKALVVDKPALLSEIPQDALPELVVADVKFVLEDPRYQAGLNETELKRCLDLPASTQLLVMYTSGTSGFPKGVQLTHLNLLSQQKALQILWEPKSPPRLLSYLPWHHSFGGLFERFFALANGGCIAIDSSLGKNIEALLSNYSEIKPTVFFSVPKIYQEIVASILVNPSLEKVFFHPELQFVFTAAAPLPKSTSDVFKSMGVPVVEGWGLTETSPCCTLTERSVNRSQGVVGWPIPGVEVRLAEENEICVRGPNVMLGYLDRPEETEKVLDAEGWFYTGDVGEFSEQGVKIVSRKDRMFKLNNGEKIFPSQVEEAVKSKCKFVKHAYIWGKGLTQPHLIVVPNAELYSANTSTHGDEEGCKKPKCSQDLSDCLGECLWKLNQANPNKPERVHKAILVNREPTLEANELTPSFKLIPSMIERNYETFIRMLEGHLPVGMSGDAFMIEILSPEERARNTHRKRAVPLHYGIIGIGPIGAVLTVHLLKAGHKVSVFTPFEAQKNAIQNRVMHISGALNASANIDDVYTDLAAFARSGPDVILIATKTSDSPDVLEKLRAIGISEKTVLISCQNGLDVEKQISDRFGATRALRLVLNIGCKQEDPTHIHVGFSYTNFLSQIDTANAVPAAFVADDFNMGGFKVELRADYRTEVFKKIILNCSLSPVCSILGVTMKTAMENPATFIIVKQLVEESIRVARAARIPIPDSFTDEAIAYLSKGGDHKPSMALDIENGRRTENDDHSGKLVEIAKSLGVQIPVTETIYNLLKSLESKVVRLKKETPHAKQ